MYTVLYVWRRNVDGALLPEDEHWENHPQKDCKLKRREAKFITSSVSGAYILLYPSTVKRHQYVREKYGESVKTGLGGNSYLCVLAFSIHY